MIVNGIMSGKVFKGNNSHFDPNSNIQRGPNPHKPSDIKDPVAEMEKAHLRNFDYQPEWSRVEIDPNKIEYLKS